MKKSELIQLIKEEILAEAKKDKSGLPFALAANIVKYGQPQTPKGAKKTDLSKKQEKQVKKTAEKLKKSIKEAESTTTDDDNLYDDLPAVDMHIDDNGHMSISIQAMFHSPDNGKVDVLLNDPNLREKVVKVIQQQAQNMFRSTIHGLAGEPYGLKENKDNYMFFQNLKTIKEAVDEMLAMDPKMVDMILSNGHDWANDHISTSKDDTEEVYNFLKSKSSSLVAEDEKPNLKIGDKVKYENQEWEIEKFLSNGTVRLKHLKGLPSTNVSPEKIAKLHEKKLVGGQKKLDANKNGKIDAEDFKLLKAKNKK